MSTIAGHELNVRRKKAAIPTRNKVRRRVSVSLSEKSANAFDDLKTMTDAYSDSEVVRNAVRIHHALLRLQLAGVAIFTRKADGTGELTRFDLFAAN